jgi:hypothetical protein
MDNHTDSLSWLLWIVQQWTWKSIYFLLTYWVFFLWLYKPSSGIAELCDNFYFKVFEVSLYCFPAYYHIFILASFCTFASFMVGIPSFGFHMNQTSACVTNCILLHITETLEKCHKPVKFFYYWPFSLLWQKTWQKQCKGGIWALSFRRFGPWSLDSTFLGPCMRQSIMATGVCGGGNGLPHGRQEVQCERAEIETPMGSQV